MLTAVLPRDHLIEAAARGALLSDVRRKRIVAFLFDLVAIGLLWLPFAALVFFLGVVTLGAGWLLYPAIWPLVALAYVAATAHGPHAATPGMSMMGLVMRRADGTPVDATTAVVHVILFYMSVVLLTPAILALSLFSGMKRTLHDILTGVVVVNDL